MTNLFTVAASAALAVSASSALAVPIEVVYSGSVSSTDFTDGSLASVNTGDAASITISFDTDQQGAVFGPPSFVGSLYNGPITYSYDIGGVTGTGTSSSFLRFSSDILGLYEIEAPVFSLSAADLGSTDFFSGDLTVKAEGNAPNPFGVTTPDIEDVAGTYDASLFSTTQFTISAFDFAFLTQTLDVSLDTVSVNVIPAPGAMATLAVFGLAASRRRR